MLELPDFSRSHSFYFQACGRLQSSVKEEEKKYVARYRTHAGMAYLRFIRGGAVAGHFHIDIALSKMFKTRTAPEVNSTRREIEREVLANIGQPLNVLVLAQFGVMVSEVSTGSGIVFAGPSAVVSTLNEATIEVAGAHLVVRNHDFVDMIDWELFEKDVVFVDIYASCNGSVTESYLADMFRRAEDAFDTFILGRKSNDAPVLRT